MKFSTNIVVLLFLNIIIPIFYNYSNINIFEDLSYYSNLHLENMVLSETTTIISFCDTDNVDIIKQMIAHFGGGWLDENNCDDISFYPIELNVDSTIKPVKYVTMKEIYDKFGCIVVIKDK